jgi:hypothetical protein
MTDIAYPCPHCSRYTCRCGGPPESGTGSESGGESGSEADWTPWWTALASNA